MLKKNRAFFLFLLKFGVTYLVLSAAYWFYLAQYDAQNYEPDAMTGIVAYQAEDVIDFFGGDAATRPRHHENSYKFFINDQPVARIVEGCNALSVMILFTAFVVAFSSTFKRTTLFVLTGLAIIHILNILRVALMCLSLYHYPQYEALVHDIVFPLFIYGVVFLLWILWVTKFSGHAKKA